MEPILPVLRCAVPTLYALVVALYAVLFLGRGRRLGRLAGTVLPTTLVAHLLFLVAFVEANERIPLAALPEILSVIAFMTALAYYAVERSTGNRSTGLFVLAFSAILQWGSSGRIALVQDVPELLRNPAFGLHTATAILGYAAFAVSAIYGLLYLFLYQELKTNRFGRFYRKLPPLEILGKMNIRAAVLGLVSLTIGILSGIVWAARLHPGFLSDPMFLMTGVVWLVFAFGVFAHYRLGWRGKPTVYVSISGFLLMGIVLVAVNLFLQTFHRFDVVAWNFSSLV
ncbi:MAG: hypothetical protein GF346_10735 [Candidatus Eisenbacteria bacterium]|nr:hypothetical protein [Candidatus Latescibacterota bacterium]MBD3302913.1 hypothetical protein [Candidatus Eisenbacteria bacterium]